MLRMLITAGGLAALVAAAPFAEARDVWHAARVLLPGDTLRAADAEALAIAPVRDRPDLLGAEQRLAGLEVKRRIAAGTPLSQRDVGPPDLVHASQPTRIFWRQEGMSIEMQGRALESGPLGAEVRVGNGRSGRVLRGRVVAEGTVEVVSQGVE